MRSIGLLAMAGAFVIGAPAAQADDLQRPGTVSRIDSTLQNALTSLAFHRGTRRSSPTSWWRAR